MHRLLLFTAIASIGLGGGAAAQHIANGRYYGTRGYYKTPFPSCHDRYEFFADVTDGIIKFDSEDRIWTGDIDQATGQIFISSAGISPPLRQNLFIKGPFSSARMFSATCGEGFFSLLMRR